MQTSETNQIVKDLQEMHGISIEPLIKYVKSYLPDLNEKKLRDAYYFAARAHDGQMRKQGIPYIAHPLEAAKILSQIRADETTLIATLLHDVPEDTTHSLEEIEHLFGQRVAFLVEGITKLSKVHYRHDMQQRQVESLKQLFIHVAKDPRTMLIKLADRLHNMRTLEFMDKQEKRVRIARETLEIFAPVANLLGIKEIQVELENLCFKNIHPELYEELRNKVKDAKESHLVSSDLMITQIKQELSSLGIQSVIFTQERNLYDIYKYLLDEHKSVSELDPRFFMCILVGSVEECYRTLGVVHRVFRPINSSFHDYISTPKANGYQSLHTSVFGQGGIVTKFQIRTHQMHYEALYGVAASYFTDDPQSVKISLNLNDPRSQWLGEVIEIQNEQKDRDQYLIDLKTEVFQDRITTFTPNGEPVNLPKGATCIDFAYSIHTEVGHRAIRAVINEVNSTLNQELSNGDVVKIVTTDYPKSPSYEWLTFCKTNFARKKMKEFFKRESYAAKIKVGKKILQKEFDRAGLGLIQNMPAWRLKHFMSLHPQLKIGGIQDVFVSIAEGATTPLEFISLVYQDRYKNRLSILTAPALKDFFPYKIRVVCEEHVSVSTIADILDDKKEKIIVTKAVLKANLAMKRSLIDITFLTQSYSDISKACQEIEQIDGVIAVHRNFQAKKLFFLSLVSLSAISWLAHPLLVIYIESLATMDANLKSYITNFTIFSGLLVMAGLIWFFKRYSLNSFPGLRDSKRLWWGLFLLQILAGAIITLEIIFLLQNFNLFWILVLVAVSAITTCFLRLPFKNA